MVSTSLKNISQNGNLPQIGMKIKNLWNHHHLVTFSRILGFPQPPLFPPKGIGWMGHDLRSNKRPTSFQRPWRSAKRSRLSESTEKVGLHLFFLERRWWCVYICIIYKLEAVWKWCSSMGQRKQQKTFKLNIHGYSIYSKYYCSCFTIACLKKWIWHISLWTTWRKI